MKQIRNFQCPAARYNFNVRRTIFIKMRSRSDKWSADCHSIPNVKFYFEKLHWQRKIAFELNCQAQNESLIKLFRAVNISYIYIYPSSNVFRRFSRIDSYYGTFSEILSQLYLFTYYSKSHGVWISIFWTLSALSRVEIFKQNFLNFRSICKVLLNIHR